MFRVNGMQIMMTAGDTGLLAVIPDEEGYVPTAEDRAVFTVREKPAIPVAKVLRTSVSIRAISAAS